MAAGVGYSPMTDRNDDADREPGRRTVRCRRRYRNSVADRAGQRRRGRRAERAAGHSTAVGSGTTEPAVVGSGRVLAVGTLDEVRGEASLEERFVELVGGAGELEGLEWLHTFSD